MDNNRNERKDACKRKNWKDRSTTSKFTAGNNEQSTHCHLHGTVFNLQIISLKKKNKLRVKSKNCSQTFPS